jgi:F5/8 type C domain/Bacterial Ig domain/Calcineurin-like phosphoesterase
MSFIPTHALADFNFGAAGDWGCTSNTDATLTNMKGKGPERVFALGDYSYASTGTCFFNKIDPTGLTSITKIAIGNHEDDDSEGFSSYMSHFGLSQTYYSYNYNDVHVLVMDTDRNSYASGSAQRNFVQSDLQAASTNPNIKWIIVYLHKELYTSPNTCSSSSCSNSGSEPTNLRNGFHPMFDQYGVDLVLQGHVHNYQRTYQIKYDPGSPSSPTITSNNANTYTEGNGEVFAIVGVGGVNFHALSGKASWVSSQQDDFFGQLDIKSTDNGNKLEGKFYRNGNNAILDSFSITKANSPPVANNQAVTTNKNTAKSITLTATDANNDPLTYSIVTQPSHGTLSPSTPGGAARTYTPNTNYVGPDSFTFKANDGKVDSNTATVSINVQDTTTCGTNLPISGVTASGNQVGYPPSNVLDNDLGTRWSSDGIGQFITADLGSIQNICSVDIAWYTGNARQYHFVIATSTDGTTFTQRFSGDSSGTTLNSEKYTFTAVNARYVRVTVNGNTANTWASITELDIFGSGAPPSGCTTNIPISGVTASGNQVGYPPSNVLDNDLGTRWSSDGIGQFITADLGSIQNICSVDIAWYTGNARQYHFVIATSTDGTTFTQQFSGDSSGTTLNSEKYVIPATDARYVRVTVNGNTQTNTWASITELDIFGSSSSSATSLYNYGPSLTLSGP